MPASLEALRAVKDEVIDRALREVEFGTAQGRVSGLDARIAKPHVVDANGRYATATFHKTDATMNSAGGHLSTLHDLARWVTVQMDSGRIDGRVMCLEGMRIRPRVIR